MLIRLYQIRKLNAALEGALDTSAISHADDVLNEFRSFVNYLEQDKARITEISSYFRDHAPASFRDPVLHFATWMRNTLKVAETAMEPYSVLQEILRTNRSTVIRTSHVV